MSEGTVTMPPAPRFKCPQGHETGGEEGVYYGSRTIAMAGERLVLDDVCARCLFDWLRATFPTTRLP